MAAPSSDWVMRAPTRALRTWAPSSLSNSVADRFIRRLPFPATLGRRAIRCNQPTATGSPRSLLSLQPSG